MRSRSIIIAISLVACGFGVLTLSGPASQRGTFYAINVVLSIVASVLLPLVGTILYILYIVFSGQQPERDAARPAT